MSQLSARGKPLSTRRTPVTSPGNPRVFWGLAALASGLTVAMRVPMLTTPLTVDEGGYGYVVRMWTRGAPLYNTVWVDRPQGLLLVYRAAFAVFGDSALTIRGLAALFAALTVLVLAEIGRRVTGSNVAGVTVGLLFALLSAAPQMEGHTANGELLSALPGSLAVLCVVASVDAGSVLRRRWWLWGAGIFAGGALLVKQSAYDAVIVVGIVAVVAGYRARKRLNVSMLADVAVLGFGGALMIGAAALHGMTLGWARWWFAVAGYRLSVENLSSGTLFDRTARLLRSFFIVRIHIVPILGFILLRITTIRRGSLRQWLPLLWLSASLSAFALGGLFHAHYYVGLIAAVSLCGGQGLHALAKRRATGLHWAAALCVVLLTPSLI